MKVVSSLGREYSRVFATLRWRTRFRHSWQCFRWLVPRRVKSFYGLARCAHATRFGEMGWWWSVWGFFKEGWWFLRGPKKKSWVFWWVFSPHLWIVLACRLARGTDQVFIHAHLRAGAQTSNNKEGFQRLVESHWIWRIFVRCWPRQRHSRTICRVPTFCVSGLVFEWHLETYGLDLIRCQFRLKKKPRGAEV